jgi:phospholipase C
VLSAALFLLVIGSIQAASSAKTSVEATAATSPIKHVVVLMEENHSFDNYFGTYPGANGIPAGACIPDPAAGHCIAPYHNPAGFVDDLPHVYPAVIDDLDKGKMDGFVRVLQHACGCSRTDAAGYSDATDIPNFWQYAQNYTLMDNLFEQVPSWSFPSHVAMVSEWTASCTSPTDPMSCTGTPRMGFPGWNTWPAPTKTLPWTDMTYLLHKQGVSWGYFDADQTEPVCTTNTCTMKATKAGTPIWQNPLPWFTDVEADGQLGNISTQSVFFNDVATDNLPSVSWLIPNRLQSGHPGTGTNPGSEQFVVSAINAIESSPEWSSTAILLAWDDFGGEYDHVVPPDLSSLAYGARVPGILISPYAKKGYIDHQTLSLDSFNKFIEDTFLGGQRLDPSTDGRPDSRPSVRENDPILGDLSQDFDFTQPPSRPMLLPQVFVPDKLVPGHQITITGTNFRPNHNVDIRFNCGAPSCTGYIDEGTVTVAGNGSFSTTFTAPTTIPPGYYFVSGLGTDALNWFGVTPTRITNSKGQAPPLPDNPAVPDD